MSMKLDRSETRIQEYLNLVLYVLFVLQNEIASISKKLFLQTFKNARANFFLYSGCRSFVVSGWQTVPTPGSTGEERYYSALLVLHCPLLVIQYPLLRPVLQARLFCPDLTRFPGSDDISQTKQACSSYSPFGLTD